MRIKRTKSVVAAVGLGATLAIAGAAQAQASAYGTSGFGWVTYNGVGMSRGVYNVYMSGSGNYVNYVKGGPIMTTPVSGTISKPRDSRNSRNRRYSDSGFRRSATVVNRP